MKKILLFLFLIPVFAAAQKTTGGNYTYIAQRYEDFTRLFQALNLPAGDSAQHKSGQDMRSGAVYLDTVNTQASPAGFYIYKSGVWELQDDNNICQNRFIDPITVTYTGVGMKFFVSGGRYQIGCNFYSLDSATLTLSDGGADPRKDVFYLDATGAHVLEGTEGVSPIKPQVDGDQLELTFVDVAAAATTPGISTVVIYDENTEWTITNTGTTTDPDNTTNLYKGAKSLNVTNINNNDIVIATGGATINVLQYDAISGFIKLKAPMAGEARLLIRFRTGSSVVSNEVSININKSSTNWQGFSIPVSLFNFSNSSADRVDIRYAYVTAAVHAGFYLDFFHFEDGLSQPGQGATITMGALDGAVKSPNGGVIANDKLHLQTADATYPGLMTSAHYTKLTGLRDDYFIQNLGTLGDTLATSVNDSTVGIKRLVAGTNITLTPTDTTIVIASSGGGGEANLLFDSLGTTGISPVTARNDTLYSRRIDISGGDIDTTASGGLLITIPASATAINDIGDATGAGLVTVGNNSQQWDFTGLTGSGLLIQSNTTAATGLHKLFRVITTGANASSSITSFGSEIINSHTGTSSTNVGLSVNAINGTNNHALIVPSGNGNVGFGTSTPSSKAILELSSTTQGFLLPRMNTTQQDAITSPTTGLAIYNTDSSLFRYYDGAAWVSIGTGSGGGGGMTNPMTTSQDIIVGGASGTPTRVGVGTNGQRLGVSAGNITWVDNDATWNGLFLQTLQTASTSVTLSTHGLYTYVGSADATFTLPALSSNLNRMYFIKNSSAFNVTVERAGSDNLFTTSSVTSITIPAGSSRMIGGTTASGTSYWHVMDLSEGSGGGMSNPMTTQGDIIYGGASGAATRLAGAGTDNHVLKYDLDTNTPYWGAESGGGANTALSNLASVAVNTTIASDANNTDDLGTSSLAWKDIYGYTHKFPGSTSGTITLQATATAGTNTITLPAGTGTVMLLGTNQTVSGDIVFSGGNSYGLVRTSNTTTTSNLAAISGSSAGNQGGVSGLLVEGASGASLRALFNGGTGYLMVANNYYSNVTIGNTAVTEPSSGNIPLVSSLIVRAPTITGAAGTVGNTATVYIDTAPSATVSGGTYALWVKAGTAKFGGTVQLNGYTVATLPAGVQGDVAFVTDATAPTYLATVTGGGAVVTPVFFDGTNWVAH